MTAKVESKCELSPRHEVIPHPTIEGGFTISRLPFTPLFASKLRAEVSATQHNQKGSK